MEARIKWCGEHGYHALIKFEDQENGHTVYLETPNFETQEQALEYIDEVKFYRWQERTGPGSDADKEGYKGEVATFPDIPGR